MHFIANQLLVAIFRGARPSLGLMRVVFRDLAHNGGGAAGMPEPWRGQWAVEQVRNHMARAARGGEAEGTNQEVTGDEA